MKTSNQFRPSKSQKITDADAAAKPLSSGDKAKDKLAVEDLAQRIAAVQNVFFAAHARKLLIVLQGMDTSGKDGTVKEVFGRTDPLGIRSVPFKAPTVVEREHDFLWRIHAQVPAQGEIVIFNRSHYEDVLITNVHGWIDKAESERRMAHIRDFERMLAETGTVILKFFLHISKDAQKARLEERIADPEKNWKFDPQDLVERKSWDEYQQAYATAINATDADHAPWFIIPADSKTHRNLAIGTIVLEVLEGMKLSYPPAKPELLELKIT
ncbi:PPK2 family polyphosphate:nucleotide phosphotransferase [Actimicrobium sp. GrIS 1.19]|uniref:PPK2 family polyphosphate kinase n=1 Tax=Actimicrobium sp. GrIS 1.19 TaxID=3071708 RepID=UPI002E00D3C2|nr:PPK2 family polyphosphate:nucleotide phosphotransferase [Actimicrobium sp. GrIS 1.19]